MGQSPCKIVVTGLGLVSPVGFQTERLWTSLVEGESGVRPFHFQKPGDSPLAYAANCVDFTGDIEQFGELDATKKKTVKKATKLMSREIQMGVAAALRSLNDAGIESSSAHSLTPGRVGVSFGCDLIYSSVDDLLDGIKKCVSARGTDQANFDFTSWAGEGLPKMSPLWQLKYLSNMPSSHIAIINDFRGANNSIVLREASIGAVIGEAVETLRAGKVDLFVVGATGSRIHPLKMLQTILQEEVARFSDNRDATTIAKPFDANRSGMVLGEGAGALILETEQHAEKRNAKVYAEIFAGASVATPLKPSHQTLTENAMEETLTRLLRRLLKSSPVDDAEKLESFGHINANGNGTTWGDLAEARAIANVFASRSTPIPVTTAKGHFGNLGAGSGAIELIAGILALQKNRLFPVLNCAEVDPKCPIRPVLVGDTVSSGDSFLKIAYNSQGQASAVWVKKV